MSAVAAPAASAIKMPCSLYPANPASQATIASDLTTTLARHLDTHFLPVLFDHLAERKMFKSEEIQRLRLEVLQSTRMVDSYAELYKQINGKELPNLQDLRKKTYSDLDSLKAATGPLFELLSSAEKVEALKTEKKFHSENLLQDFNATKEHIEALYPLAKIFFDIGDYETAVSFLSYYRELSRPTTQNSDIYFQALWGKLACRILRLDSQNLAADFEALRAALDSRTNVPPYVLLQQRSWLACWSLFVLFGFGKEGLTKFVELILLDNSMLQAVQIACPFLFRYLVFAYILIRKTVKQSLPQNAKRLPKDFSRALLTLKNNSDPFVTFYLAIDNEFDFEKAKNLLPQIENMAHNDFFMSTLGQDFIDQARLYFFECLIRSRKVISIDYLSNALSLTSVHVLPLTEFKELKAAQEKYLTEAREAESKGEAVPELPANLSVPPPTYSEQGLNEEIAVERKLFDLLRAVKHDGRIDSDSKQLVIQSNSWTPYQAVHQRTRDISVRTNILLNALEPKLKERAAANAAAHASDVIVINV